MFSVVYVDSWWGFDHMTRTQSNILCHHSSFKCKALTKQLPQVTDCKRENVFKNSPSYQLYKLCHHQATIQSLIGRGLIGMGLHLKASA